MTDIRTHLKTHPLMYISLDIERTLGIDPDTPGYFIVTNATTLAKQYADRTNILLIDEGRMLSTRELVEHPKTETFIQGIPTDATVPIAVTVFKNNAAIEQIVAKRGWRLLNPPASLIQTVEGKISQIGWLDAMASLLPQPHIITLEDISWSGTPFIIQYSNSHTGNGTFLIESEETLRTLQEAFAKREVRTLAYIKGPTFTRNAVVFEQGVLKGNISYQITGIPPFTDQPFATVGNDWGLAQALITNSQRERIDVITASVGQKLRQEGYRGAFGIDVVADELTGEMYLIEINARQPASIPTESYLQRQHAAAGMTIFEAHLAALCNLAPEPLIAITDGAQLVQRVTEKVTTFESTWTAALTPIHGLQCLPSPGTTPGGELLRIRSSRSVMESHGHLNDLGRSIQHCIRPL